MKRRYLSIAHELRCCNGSTVRLVAAIDLNRHGAADKAEAEGRAVGWERAVAYEFERAAGNVG